MPSVIAWVALHCWRLCVTQFQHLFSMWTWLQLWGSSCRSFLRDVVWHSLGVFSSYFNLWSSSNFKPAPAPSLQKKPRCFRSIWIHCIVIAFEDATSFLEPQLIHSFGMLGLLVLGIYYPPTKLPRAANHRLPVLNGWFKGLKRCQLHLHWSLLHHHEASTRVKKTWPRHWEWTNHH